MTGKYIDLAGQNSTGLKLLRLVEDDWPAWVAKVAAAPWLRNWVRSPLYGCEGCTPTGKKVDEATIEQFEILNRGMIDVDISPNKIAHSGAIALAIFTSAVWGFGLEGWLKSEKVVQIDTTNGARGPRARLNAAMFKILELQNVKSNGSVRTYHWDGLLPCEYRELDCWLEPLYCEIIYNI